MGISQGLYERTLDKYNVPTIEVLGHRFSVSDTLTFTTGSLPDGAFSCALVYPTAYIGNESIPHLPATYNNYKFIIVKIRNVTQGLNTAISLVIYAGKAPIWVDATLAITKKEILIK